jgi:hypothetical protein
MTTLNEQIVLIIGGEIDGWAGARDHAQKKIDELVRRRDAYVALVAAEQRTKIKADKIKAAQARGHKKAADHDRDCECNQCQWLPEHERQAAKRMKRLER